MTSRYSLPVIHPSFEFLKNICRLLHLVAALFIGINAVHQWTAGESMRFICIAQLIIAADILILVFLSNDAFTANPRTGILFRLIEAFTFTGIFISLATEGHPWFALTNCIMAATYLFIASREWRISVSESVVLSDAGITVPDFWLTTEIQWPDIQKVMMQYDAIVIETVNNKQVSFELRKNLKIEELQQINDFCSVHSQPGNQPVYS